MREFCSNDAAPACDYEHVSDTKPPCLTDVELGLFIGRLNGKAMKIENAGKTGTDWIVDNNGSVEPVLHSVPEPHVLSHYGVYLYHNKETEIQAAIRMIETTSWIENKPEMCAVTRGRYFAALKLVTRRFPWRVVRPTGKGYYAGVLWCEKHLGPKFNGQGGTWFSYPSTFFFSDANQGLLFKLSN